MAIELAQTVGCKVTTVTISQEQHDYVSKKIKDLKLTDKITLLFKDYRVLKGQYDRIISIEMIEAVGHKFLNTYFNKLNELLKPAGRIVIQAITINNSSYNQYRKGNDWIENIFSLGVTSQVLVILKP